MENEFILIEVPNCPVCGGRLDSAGRCDTCDFGLEE